MDLQDAKSLIAVADEVVRYGNGPGGFEAAQTRLELEAAIQRVLARLPDGAQ